ncbi:MAG TPA: hypothetical protein VMB25_15290 [Bryobacteraceae bacterium]|nr:hypothetical protein [Bryobacteraceae bacterium]
MRGIIIGAAVVSLSGLATYWHRGKFDVESVVWTLGISAVFIGVILVLVLWRAAHQTHLAQRSEIERALTYAPRASKAELFIETIGALQEDLRRVGQLCGTEIRPLGFNAVPRLDKMNENKWASIEMVTLYGFQQKYNALCKVIDAAHLIICAPIPPHDTRQLFHFPADFSYQEVLRNIEDYGEALRAYAAKTREEVASATISDTAHT